MHHGSHVTKTHAANTSAVTESLRRRSILPTKGKLAIKAARKTETENPVKNVKNQTAPKRAQRR